MQCELLGAVQKQDIDQLLALLGGLSGKPGRQIYVREVVLRAHTSPFTELHLVQNLATAGEASSNTSWQVCHQGIPVKGKGFAELPAVVRSLTAARCVSANCISFWTSLGFAIKYELIKQGQEFHICHSNHEITVKVKIDKPQVHLASQCISSKPCKAQGSTTGSGTFKQFLEPLVEFKKL